jgi:hypothetical protein
VNAVYQESNSRNLITWNIVSGASQYKVYWGTSSGVTKSSNVMPATSTLSYGHSGVVPGYTYYYRVTALNSSGGESSLSSEVSAYVTQRPQPDEWTWPTGSSDTGGYLGWLGVYNDFFSPGIDGYHLAQDFKRAIGEPVFAIADGEVVQSRTDVGGYGPGGSSGGALLARFRIIDGSYFMALYGHLENPHTTGPVKAGEILGYCNNYIPPHLHFGIHPGYDFPVGQNPWQGYTRDLNNTYGWTDPIQYLLTYSPYKEQVINPQISVSQRTGLQGTIFKIQGADFSTSSQISINIQDPNEANLTPIISFTDPVGKFIYDWASNLSTIPGTYKVQVNDQMTGKISNLFEFEVIKAINNSIVIGNMTVIAEKFEHLGNNEWKVSNNLKLGSKEGIAYVSFPNQDSYFIINQNTSEIKGINVGTELQFLPTNLSPFSASIESDFKIDPDKNSTALLSASLNIRPFVSIEIKGGLSLDLNTGTVSGLAEVYLDYKRDLGLGPLFRTSVINISLNQPFFTLPTKYHAEWDLGPKLNFFDVDWEVSFNYETGVFILVPPRARAFSFFDGAFEFEFAPLGLTGIDLEKIEIHTHPSERFVLANGSIELPGIGEMGDIIGTGLELQVKNLKIDFSKGHVTAELNPSARLLGIGLQTEEFLKVHFEAPKIWFETSPVRLRWGSFCAVRFTPGLAAGIDLEHSAIFGQGSFLAGAGIIDDKYSGFAEASLSFNIGINPNSPYFAFSFDGNLELLGFEIASIGVPLSIHNNSFHTYEPLFDSNGNYWLDSGEEWIDVNLNSQWDHGIKIFIINTLSFEANAHVDANRLWGNITSSFTYTPPWPLSYLGTIHIDAGVDFEMFDNCLKINGFLIPLPDGKYKLTSSSYVNNNLNGTPITLLINPDGTLEIQNETENPPLFINFPSIQGVTDSTATISWETDKVSYGKISYYTSELDTMVVIDSRLDYKHTLSLINLEPSDTYFYRVTTYGFNDEFVESKTGTFQTYSYPDLFLPNIVVGPEIVQLNDSLFSINWETDEPTIADVEYGPDSNINSKLYDNIPSKYHDVKIVFSGKKLFWRILVQDISGNGPVSSPVDSLIISISDTTPPQYINEPSPKQIECNSVIITWETNEPTSALLEYGNSNRYGELRYSNNYKLKHEIILPNLSPSTEYHYKVKSVDASNNGPISSGDCIFVTTEIPDTIAPVIVSSPQIKKVTSQSIIVEWLTNELSTSEAQYGSDTTKLVINSDNKYVTEHQVLINNLFPSQNYYLKVGSIDIKGNGPDFSPYVYFETKNDTMSPFLTEQPKAYDILDYSAKIKICSNEPTIASLTYQIASGNYRTLYDVIYSNDHSFILENLLPNKLYNYNFYIRDYGKNSLTGDFSYEFQTKQDTTRPLFIQYPNIISLRDSSCTLSWETNEQTIGKIMFGISNQYNQILYDSIYATSHNIELTKLEPLTEYNCKISIIDQYQNVTESTDIISFETISYDSTSPIILEPPYHTITSDTTAIVKWKTNEGSDSKVEYGINSIYEFLSFNAIYTDSHEVVLSNLIPGQNYKYRVHSTDNSGNGPTTSDIYTLLLTNVDGKYFNYRPKIFDLSQNYPNPFNHHTKIRFQLPTLTHVRVDIYNILCQKIKTLVNCNKEPGEHKIIWDGTNDSGRNVASGIYFYRMNANDFISVKKMILLQ